MTHIFSASKLGLLVLFSCLLCLHQAAASESRPPNILFILADDLGKEWVSTYGAEDIQTPNIDSLAETGMKFDNFYSTPQCTPSRVTLMTGQYPFRHGWVNHWDVPRWGGGAHFDSNANPSIARVMQSAGYRTAAAGKWQINDFRVQPEAMVSHGFDDYCMWTGFEAGNPPSANRYWDPYIHTKEGSKTYKGQFGEDIFSDFLIEFMREHKDEPMFLYYAMCLPHTPFVSTPADPNATGTYDRHKAMVRYMDYIIGKLVHALDELGLRDNTIVIYTTDNGTTPKVTGRINGREVQGGKMRLLESGVCEPIIVNCPGLVPEGEVTYALADLSDILPTCAELGGATLPGQYVFDGVSFAPLILGQTEESPRDWIMAMGGNGNRSAAALSEAGVENQYVFRDRVVRNEEYKLYISTDRQPEKLVSVINDPDERVNLLESDDPEIRAQFESLWLAAQAFPAQDNDPDYVPLPPEPWDKEVTVQSQSWKQ